MSYLDLLDTFTKENIYSYVIRHYHDQMIKQFNDKLEMYKWRIDTWDEAHNDMRQIYKRFHFVLLQRRYLSEEMKWTKYYLHCDVLLLNIQIRYMYLYRRRHRRLMRQLCYEIRRKIF